MQGCVERKKLVLELFKPPVQNDFILIYFTILNAKSFKLSPCRELIINKRQSLLELATELLEQKIDIPLERIEATKIRDVREFLLEDILDHRFYALNDSLSIVGTSPFYLEGDGSLFM